MLQMNQLNVGKNIGLKQMMIHGEGITLIVNS